MSYVFKPIDKSSTIIESNVVNFTQNLTFSINLIRQILFDCLLPI